MQQLELGGTLQSKSLASQEDVVEFGDDLIEIIVELMARMMIEIVRPESEVDDDR